MVVLHEEQVILAISSVVMSINIKLVQQLPFKDIYTIKTYNKILVLHVQEEKNIY